MALAYEIRQRDSDHLPAYEFIHGVVEVEPADIEAIVSQIEPRHTGLLTIIPGDEVSVSLASPAMLPPIVALALLS